MPLTAVACDRGRRHGDTPAVLGPGFLCYHMTRRGVGNGGVGADRRADRRDDVRDRGISAEPARRGPGAKPCASGGSRGSATRGAQRCEAGSARRAGRPCRCTGLPRPALRWLERDHPGEPAVPAIVSRTSSVTRPGSSPLAAKPMYDAPASVKVSPPSRRRRSGSPDPAGMTSPAGREPGRSMTGWRGLASPRGIEPLFPA